MNGVYTDDLTFWHPFMSVSGKQDMLGVVRLWTFLNTHLEVDTRRVGKPAEHVNLQVTKYGFCYRNYDEALKVQVVCIHMLQLEDSVFVFLPPPCGVLVHTQSACGMRHQGCQ